MRVEHGIAFCGWDEVEGGWFIECLCGIGTDSAPLMEIVGSSFDDHLRVVGVLKEE